ncbi:EAL domain-containing protein [Butyrivibrio sp. XPD2002]|uniref:EAL domain-containing protein n=1 Tax=Butyrivibrio sp. XPD2002 TaxID=1280665 RepID=UPI00041346D9|nr:EAL domain-containing protein [Butyrivibrio sp. XPD2002]
MPQFGMHMGLRYDIIGEYASLLFAVLLLIFISLTKPKKSKSFKFLVLGTVVSVFATATQIMIVEVASNVETYYDRNSFTALLVLFLVLYLFILILIFNYVNLLSEKRLKKKSVIVMLYVLVATIYFAGVIYQVAMKNLYFVRTDGIDISHFTRFYCVAGIVCVLICTFACFLRRRYVSRIVIRAALILLPVELVFLVAQIIARHSIFTGATYVMPLVILYQLFHSNPYDEETGCQNLSALESKFLTNTRRGRIFYLAYIDFPQITDSSFTPDYDGLTVEMARVCREIERISNKIFLYRVNFGTFVSVIETKERSDAENYAEHIRDILDNFHERTEEHIHYFLGVCGDSRRFAAVGNKWSQLFMWYMREQKLKDGENVYYFANGRDFREFDEVFKIEQALMDIRVKMDPEDERILCYAQPIYSVEKDEFRSAEALMRLTIDGKMIPPDAFIQIAEKNNCIHALTVIMMHKVCKALEKLSEEYDFDAVTINCSTADFTDKTFYKEIMDIIHSYKVDQKMIRLELTESMMADNYEAVKHNMDMLNKEGIQLYMDDFGTGYSNLERVVDVPVQTIKFDKSLLYKSIQDDRVDDIITYMIEFFKKNGFVTLVEGVEDETQKKFSIDRGFDYIQGYHYAKPAPIENLGKYFTKKRMTSIT